MRVIPLSMTAAFVVMVVLLLGGTVVAQNPTVPTFVVGRAGPAYAVAPGGYVLASLQDVQSKEFRDFYNPFGLSAASNGGIVGVQYCAVLSVTEGLLAYGPESNTVVVAPYDGNSNWQQGTELTSPIWLGGSGGNQYLGPVNASFQSSFYTLPPSSSCSNVAYWGIYRRAEFNFGRWGASYPTPSATAGLASLEDIKSPQFVYQYNDAGLTGLSYQSGSPGGCCALRVQEGYLTYRISRTETAYLVPHYAGGGGTAACSGSGFASFDGPQRFATHFDNDNHIYFDRLNATTLRDINVTLNAPTACNDQPRNSFAVAKQSPQQANGFGNCWEIELQYGTYTPTGGSCLADRWRYDIYNNTVHTVALNSFNTCGGSFYVYNFEINTFNLQYAQVSFTSASGCAGCNATGSLVPLVTGTEMTTLCQMTIGEFGWCNIVMQINKNYECQTPSP